MASSSQSAPSSLFRQIRAGNEVAAVSLVRAHMATPGTDDEVVHAAAQSGMLDLIHAFLENGWSMDTFNRRNQTPLTLAAGAGHVSVCEALIKAGASVNSTTPQMQPPLAAAVESGYIDVVNLLLSSGADPNYTTPNGRSLLATAARKNADVVQALVSHGAKDTGAFNGAIPAARAVLVAAFGDVGSTSTSGSGPRASTTQDDGVLGRHTPTTSTVTVANDDFSDDLYAPQESDNHDMDVYTAAQSSDVHALKVALRAGGSPNTVQGGFTPLYIAAMNGSTEGTNTLLRAGARADQAVEGGWTALHVAAQKGHVEVCRTLLMGGANPALKNASDHDAAALTDNKEILQLLANPPNPPTPAPPAPAPAPVMAMAGTQTESQFDVNVLVGELKSVSLSSLQGLHATQLHELLNSLMYVQRNVECLLPALPPSSPGAPGTLPLISPRKPALRAGPDDDGSVVIGSVFNDQSNPITQIVNAVQKGDVLQTEQLLAGGADPNVTNAQGASLLMIAVGNNSYAIAEKLVKAGADVNYVNRNDDCVPSAGSTALFRGYMKMFQLLLAHGLDLAAYYSSRGLSYLHIIVRARGANRIAVLREIMRTKKLNVDSVDNNGFTPLMYAVRANDEECIKALLEEGANPLAIINKKRQTIFDVPSLRNNSSMKLLQSHTGGVTKPVDPLTPAVVMTAVKTHNYRHVINALDHGSDPIRLLPGGTTALHIAAQHGSPELLKIFQKVVTNMDAVDGSGRTPLQVAAIAGQARCCKYLLSLNVHSNFAPLVHAALVNDVVAAQRELDAGTPPDAVGASGLTPLMAAVENGHTEIVRMLLHAGADPNHACAGWPPVCAATFAKDSAPLELLLKAGADPNATCPQGMNALFYAAVRLRSEMLNLLLKYNVDVDKQTSDGTTAFLHMVKLRLNTSLPRPIRICSKILLDHGAQILPDDSGNTVYTVHNGALNKILKSE